MILQAEYHASSIRRRRVILPMAVIFFLNSSPKARYSKRVIFASQVLRRIEYHCEEKPNNITARRAISLFAKAKNITHIKQKKESSTEFCFRIALSSAFFRKFRICNTNAVGLCPYPYSNSPIRTTPILSLFFCLSFFSKVGKSE